MSTQKFTNEDIDKLNSVIAPCIDDLNCVEEYQDLCKEKDTTKKKLHVCTTISDDGMQVDVALTNDKFFNKFVTGLAPNIKADIFLTSLFHEVGHIYTQYNLSESEWDYGWDEKADIENILNDQSIDEKVIEEQHMRYFNLPEEIAATRWAITYMEKYADDVAEFWNELQPAILRFFRKNGVK